jgi:acetate kinase
MKVLVSNIGSTSFKFRLFDIDAQAERELASGGADRIGHRGGVLKWRPAGGEQQTLARDFADHGAAIALVLDALAAGGVLTSPRSLGAVAFKAVCAGDVEPVVFVDDALLARMEYFTPVAPVHNPPYIAAMRMFRLTLGGGVPLVAAFEQGFHRTMPRRRQLYAAPLDWADKHGIRRYGYHGASHGYIAWRLGQLQPSARRVISCHLGGSSSISAIRDGASVANSMGLSPQSGVPQGTRVGDIDVFALKLMADGTGRRIEDLLGELGSKAGLAALSGTSGDWRDIETAAAGGDERCAMTVEVFATSVRDYIGSYLVELGGADAIVFTGGIGQGQPALRAKVLAGMEFAGIVVDAAANAKTKDEGRIDARESKAAIWAVATNEELMVARQAARLLSGRAQMVQFDRS